MPAVLREGPCCEEVKGTLNWFWQDLALATGGLAHAYFRANPTSNWRAISHTSRLQGSTRTRKASQFSGRSGLLRTFIYFALEPASTTMPSRPWLFPSYLRVLVGLA